MSRRSMPIPLFASARASIFEVIGVIILQPGVHQHDKEVWLLALLDEGVPQCAAEVRISSKCRPPRDGQVPTAGWQVS